MVVEVTVIFYARKSLTTMTRMRTWTTRTLQNVRTSSSLNLVVSMKRCVDLEMTTLFTFSPVTLSSFVAFLHCWRRDITTLALSNHVFFNFLSCLPCYYFLLSSYQRFRITLHLVRHPVINIATVLVTENTKSLIESHCVLDGLLVCVRRRTKVFQMNAWSFFC